MLCERVVRGKIIRQQLLANLQVRVTVCAFLGVGALVASFVPRECPVGGLGIWGIFGKPLKRAIWKTQVCMLY